MYEPAATPLATLIVITDVPEPPEVLDVPNEVVGPVGEDVALRVTVPLKPLEPVIVTVEVPALPAWIVTEAGLAFRVKSGVAAAVTVTWAVAV